VLTTIVVTVFVTLLAGGLVVLLAINVATAEKRLAHLPRRLYTSGDADFRHDMGILLGPPILSGNRVTTLVNGDRIFPAMLGAIREVRESVTFETFIFRDAIGEEFCRAMREAAGRGVRVHMLVDWAGSRNMDACLFDKVREAGGVGIGKEWTGDAQDARHWRETHFRVEGPVVAQMQSVFVDNWIKATGRVLHGKEYFPPLRAAGDMDAQMFSSSPVGGSVSLHLMVLLAINAARRSIDIENSYFVPDNLVIDALVAARRRGVRVRILVPGRHTDAPLGRRAAHALYGTLLEAGVEIRSTSTNPR
jgi:cardiolipin synthase